MRAFCHRSDREREKERERDVRHSFRKIISRSLSPFIFFSLTDQREREREREREEEINRKREFFVKGMTGALAPFSYLVVSKTVIKHSGGLYCKSTIKLFTDVIYGGQSFPQFGSEFLIWQSWGPYCKTFYCRNLWIFVVN